MDISFLFNWPPVRNSASISFAMLSEADADYEFRVGLVREQQPRFVFWLKPGWTDRKTGGHFKFIAKIDETIIVEKRNKRTKEVTAFEWNLREKWPLSARGGSAVSASWSF